MVGRILLYKVDISDDQKNAIKKIMDSGKLFKKENNSKQIGSTNKRKHESISYENQEDFINKVIEIANEYRSIMLRLKNI
jgi:7,8-dihydro-6-hydroxymethylpterin-pyrophosphokinase